MAHPGGHNHYYEIKEVINEQLGKAVAAMGGDMEFSVSPETKETDKDKQNVGEKAESYFEVTGDGIKDDGEGDIEVKVEFKGEKYEVTFDVANSDSASDIAGKLETALGDSDVDDVLDISRSDETVTLTAKEEGENIIDLTFVGGSAEFEDDSTIEVGISEEGKDPYTRTVTVKLVNGEGKVHDWFNDEVTIAIAEDTSGDGEASISSTDLSLSNGIGKAKVTLTGTWADSDTNTLTVSEQDILGYTLSSKTSVETSTD